MSVKEIRTALSEDREAVLAFCTQTFPDGDYIEHVWDNWLQDPAGQLLVATIDGQPVGAAHILMLNGEEAWLEGLRVDPTYRRQGLARALSETASVEAMRRGATILRLAVDSQILSPSNCMKVCICVMWEIF
ncbi:GNAT family N-acetyltransferase [Dictyobacter arantiisoli]|uniref:N-acetyltransferase domain-containing protein n=1 Tax=Dictyobacter arantiisoli TaxID=2014874 RepID=A0A5A5TF75_9CHLR|nr:GNAT family N-acetyltransferase [Dictyobacter arantiisoli]GCF09865.1 hypothetical protein KDI_34290 [Dictyobacter arantiisoli]